MNAIHSNSRSVLECLRTENKFPIPDRIVETLDLKPANRKIMVFAIHVFELFGQNYARQIREKLGQKTQSTFDLLQHSYHEIQKNLDKQIQSYVPDEFPQTKRLIDQYQGLSESAEQIFAQLKEQSFRAISFPQKILTASPSERGLLDAIESTRNRALRELFALLEVKEASVDEKKGAEPPGKKALDPELECSVNQLYFSGVAFIHQNKRVYLSELIDLWSRFRQKNGEGKEALLQHLCVSKYINETTCNVFAFMKYNKPSSFQSFLIYCTMESLKGPLGWEFSEAVENKLCERFLNESVRSDTCYFLLDLRRFYEIDFSTLKRPSSSFLTTLQLFFFVIRTVGIEHQNQDELLRILLCRSPLPGNELEGFASRCWDHQIASQQDPFFTDAWKGLQELLQILPQTERNDPHVWSLLVLLWKNQNGALVLPCFRTWAEDTRFSLKIRTIYQFCQVNSGSLNQDTLTILMRVYHITLKALDEKKIDIKNAQDLFLDPPLEQLQENILHFSTAQSDTGRLVDWMRRYPPLSPQRNFTSLLRHFLTYPDTLIFKLLEDIPRLGIKEIDEEFLWEVVSTYHPLFSEGLIAYPIEACLQAIEMVVKLHEEFPFTPHHRFSLYLEFIRLVLDNKIDEIGRIGLCVDEFLKVCPYLDKKDIYFLYRYHPSISFEEVAEFAETRTRWLLEKEALERFVLDQTLYQKVIHQICQTAQKLGSACPLDREKESFIATFQHSLLNGFFPPLQPLTDYFRISNVTEKEGIRWQFDAMATHTGQLKSVMKSSSFKVYFDWSIRKDYPTLSFSFFDVQTMRAYSTSVPIEVSSESIAPEKRRLAFYSLLYHFSQYVLKEEADKPPESDLEIPEAWMSSYEGVRDELNNFKEALDAGDLLQSDVDQIWEFLRKVKVSYRTLYLSAVANRPLPPFSFYSAHKVAGLGHIFSDGRRGSLVPKALRLSHPAFYAPDADLPFIDEIRERGLFKQRTLHLQPLELMLKVTANGNERVECPIEYLVQSADDLTHLIISEKDQNHWNDKAPPLSQVGGSYVTLQVGNWKVPLRYPPEVLDSQMEFRRYFDFHNLLLKARVYCHE